MLRPEHYDWLQPSLLRGMLRGIEKESLRVDANGRLAQTPHPMALGSALTHENITTDYSEALLELITPALPSVPEVLESLTHIHQFVYRNLPTGERLWPLSMPCLLDLEDDKIPLAQYGNSNVAKLKTLYRKGLGLRYGRRMQTIAGIHYNLSFPAAMFADWQLALANTQPAQEFIDQQYFSLIRNVKRLAPMVLSLLGASPAVCACFLQGREHHLQPFGQSGILYLPKATTLRMGRLGYQNSVQQDLAVSYNQLTQYCDDIGKAISAAHPTFVAMGVDDADGTPQQINGNVLQIENEFYALIRPKQITQPLESPTQALRKRGVLYVELRMVDIDATSNIGLRSEHAYFLEVFTLYALLLDSAPLSHTEQAMLDANHSQTVDNGQDMQLRLQTVAGDVALGDFMQQHLTAMQDVAAMLDKAYATAAYSASLLAMRNRAQGRAQLPSKQLLDEVAQVGCFGEYGKGLAQKFASQMQAMALDPAIEQDFVQKAEFSLAKQADIEAQSVQQFEEFLQRYR